MRQAAASRRKDKDRKPLEKHGKPGREPGHPPAYRQVPPQIDDPGGYPGVAETHNRAEQPLRPAVIARKLSCGHKTERSKRTWEILATSPPPATNEARISPNSSVPICY